MEIDMEETEPGIFEMKKSLPTIPEIWRFIIAELAVYVLETACFITAWLWMSCMLDGIYYAAYGLS